jgi:predicted ATPase/class 3 adenylate cyclase
MTTEQRPGGTRVLPTGTVTFLFTDIEGSTRLVQELGDARYGREVLEVETGIVEDASSAEGGFLFGSQGDAHFVAFSGAVQAIRAAAEAQRRMAAASWPDGRPVRIRMGIHTGEVIATEGSYQGLELHRVARLAAAGYGGQVLVSDATRALAAGALPDGLELTDLGEHRLKDLARPERLHQLTGPGLEDSFPPPRTLDAAPNNLPTQLTSFVGRAEVDRGRRLLARTRLLSLTGPGGTGKTRLSLQLAAESVGDRPGGVWFVPLSVVTDPALVPSAIATAVGLTGAGRPPHERVIEHFRDRRAMLVLDNFEQVTAAAPFVSELLSAAGELQIVVTSRSPLRIYGEQEFAVPPLSVPDPKLTADRDAAMASEAVRLFVERAMAVRADFALTDEDVPVVADIVRRLDGLPLAIELAAARVRVLSPGAIRDRLSDRLRLLTGGARDLPARQRTLRGAIDWSHDLLDPDQRRLFARLGVFAGGANLETAETVCGPDGDLGVSVLDGIESLAEKSLIRVAEDAHGDSRFLMLETIREYAVERLEEGGEAAEVRDRHAVAYLELLRAAGEELYTGDRRPVLDRIEDDHDNIRAALAWRIDSGDAAGAGRLLGAVWRFWQMRGHLAEGVMRAAAVLAMPGFEAADATARLRALEAAGGLSYWSADITTAHRHYAAALELARASGDKREIAQALYNLLFAPAPSTSPEEWAAQLAQGSSQAREALALFRELGDERGVAWALWGLGEAALYNAQWTAAEGVFTEALGHFERLDDLFGQGWALFTRGTARHAEGRLELAVADQRRALELFSVAGDVSGIALVLAEMARLAQADGDLERAHRIAGAAKKVEDASGAHLASTIPSLPETVPVVNVEPDPEPRLAVAWAEGEAMSREEAIAYALGGTAGEP